MMSPNAVPVRNNARRRWSITSARSSAAVKPVYGGWPPAVRIVAMIASVLARFDAMSASATMSCASRPVAIGIELETAVYLL